MRIDDINKTAIQWLIDNLEKYELYSKISYQCLGEIEIALEMEKTQIMNAWNNGFEENRPYVDHSEEYYEKTFKQD